MAKFNYDELQTGGFKRSEVGYFNSLKKDNDYAIVRFAYKTGAQFDTETVHKVNLGGNWRNVSCLKPIGGSADECPLCKAGEKISYKVFVKLVEYTKDKDNNVIVSPKIWERPSSFCKTLKSYMETYKEYGDLYQFVFKVVRHGVEGDTNTTYELIPVPNQAIYPLDVYKCDLTVFDKLDLSHHSFMNKSFADLQTFVTTGKFPEYVRQNASATETATAPVQQAAPVAPVHEAADVTQDVPTANEVETPKKRTYTWE